MSTIVLTKENFEDEVLSSDKPVLVDFWAPWCGPCRMLSPVLEEVGKETADRVKIGKVNVDEEQELAAEFNVMSIPMLAVIQAGKLAAVSVGVKPKAQILELLEGL
ncbi:thioredoxin [Oscillospiraceae bacterium MB08-C2-2]|nr:thioredoxin [Oscillospiraceae bacterium MB08-C2-2]